MTMKTRLMKKTLTLNAVALAAFLGCGLAQAADQECESGPAILGKIVHAENEKMNCLDSEVANGKIRALVYSRKGQIESTFVVTGSVNAEGTEVIALDAPIPLSDAILYPKGCGQYLMGGRMLPGFNKVALVYAQKIRTVDFSNPSALEIALVNDRSIPGMASTCEGYMPNWEGGREDLVLDAAAKTLTLETTSREAVEQIEEKKISRPEEFKFYRRIYGIQCGVGSPERGSQECLDIKRARDQGVYPIRREVYPKEKTVVRY